MKRKFRRRTSQRWVWMAVLLLVWLFCSGAAQAGPLSDRLATFPDWSNKPPVQAAKGDLAYPDWMAGEWSVTTTLVDLAAPLAPDLVTPGFESNRPYLNQPISFRVKFGPADRTASAPIVADRAFNGLNLARAYLGDDAVMAVKVDPASPNRQITILRGDRQLTSTVTGRATEKPDDDHFLTTEVFQQVFRGIPQPYLNEVETTTAYHQLTPAAKTNSDSGGHEPAIEAAQVTAIYLSPRDPDYFKALNRPVALYRYRLLFFPAED